MRERKKYFQINNRKYLGSKTKLIYEIHKIIDQETKGDYRTVIDLFAGTGIVSDSFIRLGKDVIVNDFLESNHMIYKSFFTKGKISSSKLEKICLEFNENKYFQKNYFNIFGSKYFTENDATQIGSIRESIEDKFRLKEINSSERDILISSLLFSTDRSANSMGHYEIYIEREIEDKFYFKLIDYKNRKKAKKIYSEDANELIDKISGDVLYLDPPYNSRQYSNLYHLLDNLCTWDNPLLFGKGLKPIINKKSRYSMKEAKEAMLHLILNADVKYIFISYNNTQDSKNSRTAAKISNSDMIEILSLRGKVKKIEIDFTPYNTGNSKIKNYKEIIYICKIDNPTLKKRNVKYPFNYMGGKFKTLDEIQDISLLHKEKSIFIDPFVGGANVSINSGFKKIVGLDSNKNQIEILNILKETPTFVALNKIDTIIKKYGFSESHKNGYEFYDGRTNIGLKKHNQDPYTKLRVDYNLNKDPWLLMILIIFSFNNTINFNLKGDFNIPVGKRDFNKNMRKNFILFSQKLKIIDITFIWSDFRNIPEKLFTKNSLFYFDPPYLTGVAHYNKFWGENEEKKLLELIKEIGKNSNWILSNSIKNGDISNELLKHFIQENCYSLVGVDKNYDNSWFHKKSKGNNEIILHNLKE